VQLLIGDLLADATATAPATVAATFGEHSISYRELDATTNRVAHALRGLGVAPGDVVGWWSGPTLTALSVFAAVARLGATFAPVNPALSEQEAAAVLELVHPRLLIVDAGHMEMAASVLAAPVAVVDAPGARSLPGVDLEQLVASAGATPLRPDRPLSDADPHVIYPTSGTTGAPKGVVVSHRASWLRSFPGGSTFAAGLRGDGGILASFPLYHYGGWHYVLEAWHHRCPFHLCSRFDGASLVDTVGRWRPTAMYCIPAVWARFLDALPPGTELLSVHHADTGTSAAPLELLLRLRDRFPAATTSVLYGSSEGGHHTTLQDWDVLDRPGSVGRVAPPGVLRVEDTGEILYRSPTLMLGYFERPDLTDAALAGGWYHTGDIGVVDNDGYLYITGRASELIRTGGEYVSPSEVEAALAGGPGIAEVAVVGAPDDRWGEIVCAVVRPVPGEDAPTVDSLRAHLAGRLAAHKHPRRLVLATEIPRTAATGQIQRSLIRERLSLLSG
jgi:fatty-acyl-CoA synthase